MKKCVRIITLIMLLLGQQLVNGQSRPFITSWSATTAPDTISIPLNGSFAYDFDYVWKDASGTEVISGTHTSADGAFKTGLPTPGTYTLEIVGDFPHLTGYPKSRLLDVLQWGDIVWGSFNNTFSNWQGTTFTAPDAPVLSEAGVSFFRIFRESRFRGDISHWDLSNVNAVNEAFEKASAFNSEVGSWNLGGIANYSGMFNNAINFQGKGLSKWNIEDVTNFGATFNGTAIPIRTYDSMLVSWAAQEVKSGVSFGASGRSFCLGEAARDSLISKGWTITDAGKLCFSGTDILTFDAGSSQVGESAIDTVNHTVNAGVLFGTDLTTIVPSFTLSQNAISIPKSGEVQDFTNPFTYEVIAVDGSTQEWVVTISNVGDIQTDILTFEVPGQVDETIIDPINHEVKLIFQSGANVTALRPSFTLSDGASSSIASGSVINLTNPVTYTITAEDGVTTQDWTVSLAVPFITAWNMIAAQNLTIGIGSGNDFVYIWTDANGVPVETGKHTTADGNFVSSFAISGIYTLEIFGDFPRFNNYPKGNLLDVLQWGDISWQTLSFESWPRARFSATDAPDLSNVTSLFRIFRNATSFNSDLSLWDVSNVTTFSEAFQNARNFNQDLGTWQIGNAGFNGAFGGASSFQGKGLKNWNVENVTGFGNAFNGTAIPVQTYDSILISWAAQDVRSGSLGASGISFCQGAAARATLQTKWAISDGGQRCSEATNIITFTIDEFQLGESVIDTVSHTVNATIFFSAGLTSLTPRLTLSPDATVSPVSGTVQDFTSPVSYEVSASDGTIQSWTVTVANTDTPLTDTDILSFEVSGDTPVGELLENVAIDDVEHQVRLDMLSTDGIETIIPEITISRAAGISPASGEAIDISTGSFTYLVTAEDGITTQAWNVILNDLRPANDFCINAELINVGDTISGNTTFATNDASVAPNCGSNLVEPDISVGVWYRFIGTGETITLNTCSGDQFDFDDTSLSVYTGSCTEGLVCLTGNEDAGIEGECGTDGVQASLKFNSLEGTEYFILVDGFEDASGAFELRVTSAPTLPPPANDNCEEAEILTVFAEGEGTPVNGDNSNATAFTRVVDCDEFGTINDVWYTFNAGVNTQVIVDIALTDTDDAGPLTSAGFILFEMYDDCDGVGLDVCGSDSISTIEVTPGTDYFLQLWNTAQDEGTFTIRINDGPNTSAQLSFENAELDTLQISRFIETGTEIDFVFADDEEGHTQLFSITAGNEEGIFTIDAESGAITIADASLLSASATSSFSLTIQAADQGPGDIAGEITLTVNVIDNAPPVVASQVISIDENTENGTLIATFEVSDPDGDEIIPVTGTTDPEAILSLDESGSIFVNDETLLDFETNPSITVTYTVRDNGLLNLTATGTIIVNLNDINEVPEVIDPEFSISQFSPNGFSVGVVEFTDQDSGQDHLYSISGSETEIFSINETTGELTVSNAQILQDAGDSTYVFQVDVADNGTPPLTGTGTITINVFENSAPVIVTDTLFVNENSFNGSFIGNVVATDADGDNLTFTIEDQEPAGVFAINQSGRMTVANGSLLDFESIPTFEVQVAATDDGSGALEDLKTIIIQLVDVNEIFAVTPPEVINIASSGSNGDAIGQIVANDPDGDVLNYTITGGNTGGVFAIGSTSGLLSIANSSLLDPATIPQYRLTVAVTDGAFTIPVQVTINVFLNGDNPELLVTAFEIDENHTGGELIATLVAEDEDGIESYEIVSGNTAGLFVLNSETGQLNASSTAVFNFEAQQEFVLGIRVTDSGFGNATSTTPVTISINDVNEFDPVISEVQGGQLDEGSPVGTVAATVIASDEDTFQTLSYAIVAGNDEGVFAINENGQITTLSVLDFEQNTQSFSLTVEVSDDLDPVRTVSQNVQVTLIDVNEAPVLDTIGDQSVIAGTVLTFTASATDPEGEALTFSLDASSIALSMSIDATTGVFSWTPATDLSGPFSVEISVSDGEFTTSETITVTVEELSSATDILTFVLAEQTASATINATDHMVAIEVAFGTDVTALTPVLTLSEGATSNPASGVAVNFANAVTYTVTAEDGATTQEWTVTVTEGAEVPETATDILTFVLTEQTGDAVINATDHTVSIEVAFGTDLTSLTPTITLSEGATSDPASGVAVNFMNAVTYTVTAEDGTTSQEWEVTVTEDSEEPDTDTDILTFVLAEQTGDAIINATDHTVSIEVAFGTDVTALVPVLTLSEGATSSPASGVAVNFTNAVTYTVTAEDGATTQDWLVTVTEDSEEPDTDTDILTFVLAEQTEAAVINATDHTVAIEVAFGTDLTSLTPTITLSEGATSDPASGVAVNFTNAVTYTVTAEDGITIQDWTVSVKTPPLGLDETIGLVFYPNPVRDILHVKTKEVVKVSLTDLSGRMILSERIGSQFEMDLSQLENGVYLLIIKHDSEFTTQRIIKGN